MYTIFTTIGDTIPGKNGMVLLCVVMLHFKFALRRHSSCLVVVREPRAAVAVDPVRGLSRGNLLRMGMGGGA